MPQTGAMSDLGMYRRLLLQARPYWAHLGMLFALSLLATPVALLAPLPLKLVVDSVLGSRPFPHPLDVWFPAAGHSPAAGLVLAIGLLITVTLLAQLLSIVTNWLRAYIGEYLVLDFRARLLEQGQRLSLSYHDAKGTVDTVYRIQQDATTLQYVAVDGFIPFVSAIISVVTMLVVTARLDWQLSLVALAIAPVLFILSRSYRPRMRRQSRAVKKLESSAQSVVQEILSALRVVKAFGQERRETDRFATRAREGVVARLRLALMEGRFGLMIGLTTAIGTGAVLFIGVGHVRAGVLTLGSLLMAMSYLTQLYSPLATISRKAASLQNYLASAERSFALLDEAPDVPERPSARPIDRARGIVEFQNVTFGYDPAHPVVHDVSFLVAPGTRVAIMGATGAGKTTLLGLLTRFYDPAAGAIRLDGVDLRDYKVADLRRQFAVVLQHPLLFSTNIAENIAYGRPGAAHADIVEAAAAAGAHDFIQRLPRGYETQVGELGQKLSGGERQRIALARAFLRDAPLLILDEPTSSVDLKTESIILEALERLMRSRTVFLITHRPSSWGMCDLWLQLEHGRLIRQGAPTSLPAPAVGEPRP
ncbi:MAG TPA: ABC transporter ATP-binding protein [Gemmatimonadales bacterium]|nr:ABC transporter ATP-binding protein [Gemmatimonadales bacterium]